MRPSKRTSKALQRVLIAVASTLVVFTMVTMRTLNNGVHDGSLLLATRSISIDEPYYDTVVEADTVPPSSDDDDVEELDTSLQEAEGISDEVIHRYPVISSDHRELFPNNTKDFLSGMKFLPREAFYEKFNVGYGMDKSSDGNQDVMLLYQSQYALPSDPEHDPSDLDAALGNCDNVQVVMVEPKPGRSAPRYKAQHRHCIAIMGQWESRHVHRFARINQRRRRTNNFGYKKHHHLPQPPSKADRDASQEALISYLSVLDDALERLKPIAEQASLGNNNTRGPIIVMVANSGQATFFVNFVCAARHRHLDLSHVLLFATDRDMHELAIVMGVRVFYDERIFASIPKEAAKDYHDNVYGRIMMSKVYCVHMVNALGYNLLFQDLDLVWYQNPLDYFADKVDPGFDMYFQHDGHHHPERFKPLAANTGVYFVRYNPRTEYFFSVFVRMGELVLADKSHQVALTTLANEHMALWGLRVKVLQEDSLLFLSGYHKNTYSRSLKDATFGRFTPVLYHVNWMDGDLKKPALIESNNWFVNNRCERNQQTSVGMLPPQAEEFFDQCCLAAPLPRNAT